MGKSYSPQWGHTGIAVEGKKVRKPPQRDGLHLDTVKAQGLVERNGVLLSTTHAVAAPVDKVFGLDSIAYRRRLAGHRRRIKKEQARLAKDVAEKKTLAKQQGPTKQVRMQQYLPFRIDPDDLKVVNCAKCEKTLLAECLEYIRDDAEEFGLQAVEKLPPPVCARLFGSRPYCSKCVQELIDGGKLGQTHQRSGHGTD